ncbi:MAG: glycoside hydrolase family 99-like domain-containing protein [Bacteroidota bacterium]
MNNSKKKARVIAMYLPQFHPVVENDEWWGKGFTEWTNVGKAKSLFKGHYQPRVPADLGYYDLRLPEVRVSQAEMAAEAGVEGFMYWHYWFGEGKRLLERPFNEVLESGSPNFPFCLGWANESWENKLWNANDTKQNKLLIEQKYLGEKDNELHFNSLLSSFKDKRYIRVDGRPIFFIYKPQKFKEVNLFISQWNNLAKINGINEGFYFVAHADSFEEYENLIRLGFDAIEVYSLKRIQDYYKQTNSLIYKIIDKVDSLVKASLQLKKLRIVEYKKAIELFINKKEDSIENVIPTILPNWDHSPRSGNNAWIVNNSTPELFQKHIKDALECVKNKPEERKIIFLKSWNEWAEGNYMEPDLKFGKGYIHALRDVIFNK